MKKKWILGAMVIAGIVGLGVAEVRNVFASVDIRDGNGSIEVPTTCETFPHGIYKLCGNGGSGGGGMSWHIYSTSNYSGPQYDAKFLKNGGITTSTIAAMCPASKYDYYVALGFEGPNLGSFWGPAQKGKLDSKSPYNNYNAVGTSWVEANIESIPGDTRLAQGVAEWLIGKMSEYGSPQLTSTSGYFCVSKEAITGEPEDEDGDDDDDDKTGDELCKEWQVEVDYKAESKEGRTDILEKVRNPRLEGTSKGWQTEVTYAMPGDKVTWQTCYYPGVQATYNTTVTLKEGDHNASNSANTNGAIGNDSPWKHYVQFSHDTKTTSKNKEAFAFPSGTSENGYKKFTLGTSDIISFTNTQTILANNNWDPGYIYWQKVETGDPIYTKINNAEDPAHTWKNTPCSKDEDGEEHCTTYQHSNSYITYTKNDGIISSEARVEVPYNFENVAAVSIGEKYTEQVYAGERISVDNAFVGVGVRYNAVTEGIYATQVEGAQVKLVAFVSRDGEGSESRGVGNSGSNLCDLVPKKNSGAVQCEIVNEWGGTLNEDGVLSGSIDIMDNSRNGFINTYNVFDASAGDYMCFSIGVYPYTVNGDRDLNAYGTGNWYISAPVCSIIAKKPSFQVLGGSLYVDGDVTTNVAEKRNVYGAFGYFKDDQNKKTMFGSWVEQSAVVNGRATLLASGAAMGSAGTEAGAGSMEGSSGGYCKSRVPLSIANYDKAAIFKEMLCPNISGVSGGAGIVNRTNNRKALVDYFTSGVDTGSLEKKVEADGVVDLSDPMRYTTLQTSTGRAVRYIKGEEDMEILGATIERGVTYVIETTGNVLIRDDILYEGGDYNNGGEVPQVVIYAGKKENGEKGKIAISCGVREVDAILIAGVNVISCSTDSDRDAEDRQNQLMVRGMVVADGLNLGRTYGAAMGAASGEPAEVFNYDTSALLWGRYMAGAGVSDTLTTVYQHEIAPRY